MSNDSEWTKAKVKEQRLENGFIRFLDYASMV